MPTLNLTFPYNPDLSENKRLGWNPRIGRMYAKRGYQVAKSALMLAVAFAKAQKGAKFDPGQRILIKIGSYRPNNRSDAQNAIKGVLDAISEGIGVNDRQFDVECLGFIDKKNPRFEIRIEQKEDKL